MTTRPLSVLSLATEWHSAKGGISTFNRELCDALARQGCRVFCGVPSATDEERQAAALRKVTLVTPKHIPGMTDLQALSRPLQGVDTSIDVVIGHGRITGSAALAQLEDRLVSSDYVHFVHMDPKAIEWTKDRNDDSDATRTAEERRELEVSLARQSVLTVAVGPELHAAYEMYLRPKCVHEFLPGLFPSDWVGTPPSGIACLVFGRAEDAELKGVVLAAEAMRIVSEDRSPIGLARLIVRGSPPGKGDALHERLRDLTDKKVRLVVEEFTSNIEVVRQTIRGASLVLMPSHEEGFGLTGLEAISEGVPVLLSRTSGLAQAIERRLPHLAPLHIVDTRDGARHLAERIVERLRDRDTSFSQASQLRDEMRGPFDWNVAAADLIRALEPRLGRPSGGSGPTPATPPNGGQPVSTTQAVSGTLKVASLPLLTWQQTLRSTDDWIERPELETILKYARGEVGAAPRALVLLGPPGSGKSALMARAANQLLDKEITILGIKADRIAKTVDSIGALAHELALPTDLASAIASTAEIQPTVLFIDQLDALADLVDLHTQRLSVLLEFATQLTTAGVRVVLSCRGFDFDHDTRFRKIATEELHLQPPANGLVHAILAANDVDHAELSPSLRDLLQIPSILDAFLELRGRGATPEDSRTLMLAQLWRARLGSEEQGTELSRAAEKIAMLMAEREELWLSLETLDTQGLSNAARNLSRVGLLLEKANCVAFIHQTMFEYARARAFASSGEALSTYVFARQDALFVRPTLWTSLEYLRATDPTVYAREFDLLWKAPDLRRHVRRLLWEFLGQLQNPTVREISLVSDGLGEAAWRPMALHAIAQNRAWFEVLHGSILPGLMNGPDAHRLLEVIVAGLRFAPDDATNLIESFWLEEPTKARWITHALYLNDQWTDRMASLALRIATGDQATDDIVNRLLHGAITARPEAAAKIVAIHLTRKLKALGPIDVTPDDAPDAEDSLERALAERKRLDPFRDIIDHAGGLHLLQDAAKAAPGAFIEFVWPCFVKLVRMLSERKPTGKSYRDDGALGSSLRNVGGRHELASAIDAAIRSVAESDPASLAAFVHAWEGEETLAVHRFLMIGLRTALPSAAGMALSYLRSDPRRLVVGDWRGQDEDTIDFIKALAPHIPEAELPAIEEMLSKSTVLSPNKNTAARRRRDVHDANRRHQVRLLRALGDERLSTPSKSAVEQLERRFSDDDETPHSAELVEIGSPVSSAQMLRAKDDDILNLFNELPDATEWDHPVRRLKGGSIQASRELAEAVRQDPERFTALLHRFTPGVTERPVAYAIRTLGDMFPLERLEDKLHELVAAGFFAKAEYRDDAAWALQRASKAGAVMRSETCSLLESWLSDHPAIEGPRESTNEAREDSLLFGMHGGRVLPGGNFPILLALTSAYLGRPEPLIDRWMTLLEKHLQRAEASAVWEALTPRLEYVLWADVERAQAFLTRLFTRFPRVRDSREGLTIIARAIHHLPDGTISQWVSDLESGSWSRRHQAVGELLGLLAMRHTVPSWANARVEAELTAFGSGQECTDGVVLGLTHAAANLWDIPERRSYANAILLRVVPQASGPVAAAVFAAFRTSKQLIWDEATKSLLAALRDNPNALAADHGPWLVDSLREVLPSGADLIADVMLAMVSVFAKTEQLGHFFSEGPELVDIALTLQRLGGTTRKKGLDLFEMLLEYDVYGVRAMLTELDAHTPAPSVRRARPTKRS